MNILKLQNSSTIHNVSTVHKIKKNSININEAVKYKK